MQKRRLPSYTQNYKCKCKNDDVWIVCIAVSFARWWLNDEKWCADARQFLTTIKMKQVKRSSEIVNNHEFSIWRVLFDRISRVLETHEILLDRKTSEDYSANSSHAYIEEESIYSNKLNKNSLNVYQIRSTKNILVFLINNCVKNYLTLHYVF